VHSSITEIGDFDEIGVISLNLSSKDCLENIINIPDGWNNITSVYKMIGDIDSDESCECGIVIETARGLISLFCGAFPASLNVICPGFDQGLRITSFQKFKYHLRLLVAY
jgi:hypothetical protein